MNVDITDPNKLSMWLNIAIGQRERQVSVLAKQFGNDSPAAIAVRNEIAEIRQAQGACGKALMEQPHSSTPKK